LSGTLDQQLQSDKPKLALGGKVVHASIGMKYKSAGAQPVMVSQQMAKVRNVDHLFTLLLCSV